jgi:hypothetical protein
MSSQSPVVWWYREVKVKVKVKTTKCICELILLRKGMFVCCALRNALTGNLICG